jgi:hypothetical protein
MAWELGIWSGRLPEVSEATNLRKWMDWCIRWMTTQRPAASSSRSSLLPGTTSVLDCEGRYRGYVTDGRSGRHIRSPANDLARFFGIVTLHKSHDYAISSSSCHPVVPCELKSISTW